MDGLQRCFDQLAWPEADLAAKQPGATIVWPFGACEQHGPQLPLATDALFADRILNSVFEHLEAALPIWRLPVQSIGFSPEHQPFPGTLSLTAELMLQLVDQVGGQLASMGGETVGVVQRPWRPDRTAAGGSATAAPALPINGCSSLFYLEWRGWLAIAPASSRTRPWTSRRSGGNKFDASFGA